MPKPPLTPAQVSDLVHPNQARARILREWALALDNDAAAIAILAGRELPATGRWRIMANEMRNMATEIEKSSR